MDPRTRQQLTHYGAPAAFLAAVTIAVLLVKAGLNGGSGSSETVVGSPTTSPTTIRQVSVPTTTIVLSDVATTTTTQAAAQYYVIQTGDTLGGIALKYNTTVDELMRLNPDIDPSALHPGDRIRVS